MSIGSDVMAYYGTWADSRAVILFTESELMTMIRSLQISTGASIGPQDTFKQDAEKIRENLAGAHMEIFAK